VIEERREIWRKTLDHRSPITECPTRLRIAAFETTPEPLDALLRRAMREPVGRNPAALHALQTIVANRRGGVQPFLDITAFELHPALTLIGVVAPHARVTVRLKLHGDRQLVAVSGTDGLLSTNL
jgi:hypothetical protein